MLLKKLIKRKDFPKKGKKVGRTFAWKKGRPYLYECERYGLAFAPPFVQLTQLVSVGGDINCNDALAPAGKGRSWAYFDAASSHFRKWLIVSSNGTKRYGLPLPYRYESS